MKRPVLLKGIAEVAVTSMIGLFTLVPIPPLFAETYTPPASNRLAIDLTAGWKFYKGEAVGAEGIGYDDTNWTGLNLPHTWNNLDGQDGGNNYYRGVGWYRKRYSVPGSFAGRKFYLEFRGANLVTAVWVNGNSVGQHKGGYATFRFDVTPYIQVGNDNIIAVKVNNASDPNVAPLEGDFTFFGGLYRGISLVVTDPLHIQLLDYGSPGVYLTPTNVNPSSANLQITTKVVNRYPTSQNVTVRTAIVDASNTLIQEITTPQPYPLATNQSADIVQTTTIANPRLWQGQLDPYLYKAYVEVTNEQGVTDLVTQPLGFRAFSIDANQGFYLNGQSYNLRGVTRHQDRLNQGWAISEADQQEDMRLIREMGATAVRLVHYQHSEAFYQLCDQNGMVVWTEIPLINRITRSSAFSNNAQQQLLELIRQNYNHPSILFWGIGNEQRVGLDFFSVNQLLGQLAALVRTEDPYRLSTYADCCATDRSAFTTHTDVIGYNKYFGWYYGSYNDFGNWADKLHAAIPNRAIGVSEFGAGASVKQHTEYPIVAIPPAPFHPEEYQNLFHEAHWQAMKTRPFLWGNFIWNMFDSASDSRDEGDTPGRNDKGLVTYDRTTKKDAFFWYKANWRNWEDGDGKVVYITSRRFTNRIKPTTTIKVYSNADSVELKVNGVSQGSKTSGDRLFQWTSVPLVIGNNTIEAIGTKNGTTITDTVNWKRRSLLP